MVCQGKVSRAMRRFLEVGLVIRYSMDSYFRALRLVYDFYDTHFVGLDTTKVRWIRLWKAWELCSC